MDMVALVGGAATWPLAAFTISLVDFAREILIALSEYDHYA
jgi:hypothetical protein